VSARQQKIVNIAVSYRTQRTENNMQPTPKVQFFQSTPTYETAMNINSASEMTYIV